MNFSVRIFAISLVVHCGALTIGCAGALFFLGWQGLVFLILICGSIGLIFDETVLRSTPNVIGAALPWGVIVALLFLLDWALANPYGREEEELQELARYFGDPAMLVWMTTWWIAGIVVVRLMEILFAKFKNNIRRPRTAIGRG